MRDLRRFTALWSRRKPDALPASPSPDPWAAAEARPPTVASVTPLGALLDRIEATAFQVYEAHDLPTRPGHYARTPKARRWRFVTDDLTAEERWALMLANPPEMGWRFGKLQDLGADPENPPVLQAAARLLAGCADLRQRLRGHGSLSLADDMEAAVRLGAEWSAVDLILRTPPRRRLSSKPKGRKPRKKASSAAPEG